MREIHAWVCKRAINMNGEHTFLTWEKLSHSLPQKHNTILTTMTWNSFQLVMNVTFWIRVITGASNFWWYGIAGTGKYASHTHSWRDTRMLTRNRPRSNTNLPTHKNKNNKPTTKFAWHDEQFVLFLKTFLSKTLA